MLVLSRKVGERIHIGNDVFVEVRRLAGNRVTLAINAPKSVRILRGELMEAAQAFEVLEPSADVLEPSADVLEPSAHDVNAEALVETMVMPRNAVLPSKLTDQSQTVS